MQPENQPVSVEPTPPTEPITPPPYTELPPALDRHRPGQGARSIISTLSILIIAPLIALLLTAFVFQSYEVDGPSMQTTLENHDRLIVLKVPRTIASITGHTYIPHRTDIIVFTQHEASDFGVVGDRQLIKRVIGLPGERVVVKDGVVTIYNKEHPNGFSPDKTYAYGVVIGNTSGSIDLTVPANQVFVCGDNRANSLDSRSFGPINASDIVGKLEFRIYPFSQADNF